ncbi:MAG TPA: ELWxxDGT repeat protein, partial [Planctomycetota bacterium]|nr:ELWxxDGT repeat protein [Planctomycetota bacterium]
ELWITDGTPAGTVLFADLRPGAGGSDPRDFVRVGAFLFFTADDGTHGRELWVSDGTVSGTMMVADLAPGATGSDPQALVSVNGYAIFSATTPATGRELFRAGGSPLTVELVSDIRSGAGSSNPTALTATGSGLYFAADDGVHGLEPWFTDGSPSGTRMLHDVRPGTGAGFVAPIALFGKEWFFSGDDGQTGRELWWSNGQPGSTARVADINPGSASSAPLDGAPVLAGIVFTAVDAAHGRELWFSDGSPGNTHLIADLTPGTRSSVIHHLTRADVRAFFAFDDGQAGMEPWTTDGNTAAMVRDIAPGAASSMSTRAGSVGAAGLSLRVLLAADDGVNGREVWASDGTQANTFALGQIVGGSGGGDPHEFFTLGSAVLFVATTPTHGTELWTVPLALFGGANAQRLGFACPNQQGLFPDLFADGVPLAGNAAFRLQIGNVEAHAPGVVLLGDRVDLPITPTCRVFASSLVQLPFVADGAGNAFVPLPIPNVPRIAGTIFGTQATAVDAQSTLPIPVTITNGLEIVIGL